MTKKQNKKQKPRAKPLSLYPLTVEEIATVMLKTPPLKNTDKSSDKSRGDAKP